jgi:hypothetical protein
MIRQVTNARQSHLPFGLDLLRAFFEANFTIDDVCFSSSSGLSSDITPLPKSADFVAKVGDFSRGAPAAAS